MPPDRLRHSGRCQPAPATRSPSAGLVGPGPDRLGEVDVGVGARADGRGRWAGAPSSGTRRRAVRNGAHVGWLNSQTTSRPPGRVTRSISRRPAAGSTMLRSPNEMVTASKVSSPNGSRVPSPAVNGSCGRFALPTWSMPSEKSHGTTSAPASANGWLEVPVPAARSRTRSPASGADGADHLVAPAPVLAEGQHVVGDVVALRDGVEHRPDVGRLLVEVCAGHARRVGRSPVRRLCRPGVDAGCADGAHRLPRTHPARRSNRNPGIPRLQERDWGVLTTPRARASRTRAWTSPEETDESRQGTADARARRRPRRRRRLRRGRGDAPPRPAHDRRGRPPGPRARLRAHLAGAELRELPRAPRAPRALRRRARPGRPRPSRRTT